MRRSNPVAASLGGLLRTSTLASHGITRLVVPRRVCQITVVAPTTSRLRSASSPARVVRPSRVLPAVEWFVGVSSIQAAKSRPDPVTGQGFRPLVSEAA